MTSEGKKWDRLKVDYLRKVEKALSSVRHPRRNEVLEDVHSHIERRFAELEPDERTSDNLRRIIAEMGPASDYAELLDTHSTLPVRSVWWKYGSLLGLGAIVVIAVILFTTTRGGEKVGYIVTFQAVSPFEPRTAGELLSAFNENHPRNVRTHHFRTTIHDDRLQGHIAVDTEREKRSIVEMIEKHPRLILVAARSVTQKEFEKHVALGQSSLGKDPHLETPRVLPESPHRKLLDEQTMEALRRHEQFSSAWFTIEEQYEAASEKEKKKMIGQWIVEATTGQPEDMTRAIAALGNVTAGQALDVLMGIAHKPKYGNRPRWMAVRALGRIGDKKAVPLLINLLDHYNSDTRLYAKVALCEITGMFFGDSKQQWIEWAHSQGIEVKPMDVGMKISSNNKEQSRRSRLRPPGSRNETVSRNGSWPDGDCSINGRVYRKARFSQIEHAKVYLSSEQFGAWVIEVEDHGRFYFSNIPAGIYTLQTVETFGYQDTDFNPENQTVEKPTFQLREGERKSVNIEIKPVRLYRRIAGRILNEDNKPVTNGNDLCVYAWVQRPYGRWKGHYQRISLSAVDENGGYMLEELDGRPVYVQVYDDKASDKDDPYPPRFYPGTFSRASAKLVTFGDNDVIENIDITMAKTGGLVLEGLVTNESTGEPISEALVSIFHHDMFFDLFCGYTDEQGRYRIEGLGEGTFIVHVDAVHKGLVKTRKLVTINPDSQETHLDFTLRSGVTINGKFVDDKGNPWRVGQSYGSAYVEGKREGLASNFRYGNKYAPFYIREGSTVFSEVGQGDHASIRMVFPTNSAFLLPAVMPGKIIFDFRPGGQGERLQQILYQGKDVTKSGLIARPGQKIDDVTIIIGTAGTTQPARSDKVQSSEMLEFSLYDAFGRKVRSQDYKGVPIFLEFGACW